MTRKWRLFALLVSIVLLAIRSTQMTIFVVNRSVRFQMGARRDPFRDTASEPSRLPVLPDVLHLEGVRPRRADDERVDQGLADPVQTEHPLRGQIADDGRGHTGQPMLGGR